MQGLQICKKGVPTLAKRTKLSDKLYESFKGLIESSEWAEGTRIPSESELSQAHGVSRPVVREALVRLRMEGVLGSRRGSGSVVIASGSRHPRGYRPVENVGDLLQTFEFRYALECDIAALAAERRSEEELQEILQAESDLTAQIAEHEVGDADFAFHIALAKASHNSMYLETLTMLRQQILFGMGLIGEFVKSREASRIESILLEHKCITEAIAASDPVAARSAMGRHLSKSQERLLGFDLTSTWNSPVRFGVSALIGSNDKNDKRAC